MRITETFEIGRPPQEVFDYVADPANLAAWQTSKTRVEPESDGAPRQGYRIREWTKPPGTKEFEQLVEFSEFVPPSRLQVHIVEGPQPIDGTWTFAPIPTGTRVDFVAEGEVRGPMRFLGPLFKAGLRRQFAQYHQHLKRNLET
jgi:uncharacterized protein YndB with AHSA1/START domain